MKMGHNNPLKLPRTRQIWQGLAPLQDDPYYYQFCHIVYGYRAAFIVLRSLIWSRRLTTIARVLTYWMPDADGADSELYTARVCTLTGFSPDDRLDPTDANHMIPLVSAISRIENGKPARPLEVIAAWRLYMG